MFHHRGKGHKAGFTTFEKKLGPKADADSNLCQSATPATSPAPYCLARFKRLTRGVQVRRQRMPFFKPWPSSLLLVAGYSEWNGYRNLTLRVSTESCFDPVEFFSSPAPHAGTRTQDLSITSPARSLTTELLPRCAGASLQNVLWGLWACFT